MITNPYKGICWPCICCGTYPKLTRNDSQDRYVYFSCPNCGISVGVGFKTKKKAIRAWNKANGEKEDNPIMKPCPCCGSKYVRLQKLDRIFPYLFPYSIVCILCGLKTRRCLTKKEAADVWNRRVDVDGCTNE